jgi:hypothetical protein
LKSHCKNIFNNLIVARDRARASDSEEKTDKKVFKIKSFVIFERVPTNFFLYSFSSSSHLTLNSFSLARSFYELATRCSGDIHHMGAIKQLRASERASKRWNVEREEKLEDGG